MDHDPISPSTHKRRKLAHGKPWNPDEDSGDELMSDLPDTIPTQPLPLSQRPGQPTPSQSFNAGSSFAGLITSLQPSPRPSTFTKAPSSPSSRSSPSVQIAASSPPRPPPQQNGSGFKSRFANAMAPPGTSFRPPAGVAIKRQPQSTSAIDLTLDDPPVEIISADEDDIDTTIRPTTFTKSRGRESSIVCIDESPRPGKADFKTIASQFAYTQPQKGIARPAGSVHPQGKVEYIESVDKLNFIKDQTEFAKVLEMREMYPGIKAKVLLSAWQRKKGDMGDALDYLAQQQDVLAGIEDESTRDKVNRMRTLAPRFPIEVLQAELASCRGNFHPAMAKIMDQNSKTVGFVPVPKAAPKAKQEVQARTKTIAAKWSGIAGQKPTVPSPVATKHLASPVKDEQEVSKPRRRLQMGKRPSASRSSSPPGEDRAPTRKKTVITVESDDEDAATARQSSEDEAPAPSDSTLLQFFNACTALELADLANEKEEVASMILSCRPFRSLAAIRKVGGDVAPGSKSKKRPIGDKVLDFCQDMWAGYEAVDSLVKQCESLGKPIEEAMKKFGIDLKAASSDGELALTKVDDPHDSGIGTPISTINPDDELPTNKKPAVYLKQPAIMSPDLVMKDYQIFGLNWLNTLWSKRLSCILADDMGLGKTCQVIAFLSHLRESDVEGTHLVIVPGSTLENWLREFQRFCPNVRVEPYYGSQNDREEQRALLEEELDEVDVIVTTYETAVSQKADNKFLRHVVRPKVCVFDEGHALKNSNTKRHQELMRIPAEFRLLLTGTPLQNNLQELVSLLSFILPDIFHEQREQLEAIFKYKATTKDTDHGALLSAQRIKRARSMMTPFILRRKKQHVLKDIPAKHRRVEYCDMVDSQQELWQSCVDRVRAAQHAPVKGKGKSANVHMMSLRQAALHPLLTRRIYTDDKLKELQEILLRDPKSEYAGNRPDLMWRFLTSDLKGGDYALHRFCTERADYIPRKYQLQHSEWMASGKVQKLKELMTDFKANGDRVLLFSQFTSMMDILEQVFETLDIKFMRLDGSTQMAQRQDMIDQFTEDDGIPVFMLSTKAGGAGINLACANKVVIFDSSFNPQDDIQAENRAHRVGQTREVEVVRLVTRGTIEEMIHALGESKLALDERVAGNGSAAAAVGAGSDEKQAEKEGERKVEEMFLSSLGKRQ